MKDDLISRLAAIDAITQYLGRIKRDFKQWEGTARIILDHVPSAQPDVPGMNVIIDAIENAINASTGNEAYMVGLRNGMRWCWSALTDKKPEFEDMPSAQRWIPVTEKPIEGGQYIVTLKDDKEVWTDIVEWNPTFGGRWQAEFFDCEYRDIDNVVAWQPLPTPYREGERDE